MNGLPDQETYDNALAKLADCRAGIWVFKDPGAFLDQLENMLGGDPWQEGADAIGILENMQPVPSQ